MVRNSHPGLTSPSGSSWELNGPRSLTLPLKLLQAIVLYLHVQPLPVDHTAGSAAVIDQQHDLRGRGKLAIGICSLLGSSEVNRLGPCQLVGELVGGRRDQVPCRDQRLPGQDDDLRSDKAFRRAWRLL